ncbi:hypothetical protein NMY22_g18291 [Coprinellus aureogranulatus]|nr:hypothetical protein NMY22_g18291 [Coprinellus aureogranulatus]
MCEPDAQLPLDLFEGAMNEGGTSEAHRIVPSSDEGPKYASMCYYRYFDVGFSTKETDAFAAHKDHLRDVRIIRSPTQDPDPPSLANPSNHSFGTGEEAVESEKKADQWERSRARTGVEGTKYHAARVDQLERPSKRDLPIRVLLS